MSAALEVTRARRFPVGAEVGNDGVTRFRVWAPAHSAVYLACEQADGSPRPHTAMNAESGGYFSLDIPDAGAGTRYRYRLGADSYPDPASRFQPEGPHGPSEVIDPS